MTHTTAVQQYALRPCGREQCVLVGFETEENEGSSVLVQVSALSSPVIAGNVRCIDSVNLAFRDRSVLSGMYAGAEQDLRVGEQWQYAYGRFVKVTSILIYYRISCIYAVSIV